MKQYHRFHRVNSRHWIKSLVVVVVVVSLTPIVVGEGWKQQEELRINCLPNS